MRQQRVVKAVRKTGGRRDQQDSGAAPETRERPEIRKDIHRTWWPDA
ncbi:hypothetical protein [Streptomyces sp. NPDC060194]